MNITGHDQRAGFLAWAEKLAEAMGLRDASTAQAIRSAADHYREHRFVLTVLGKAKRGKSTLVNALLGRTDDELAPVDKLPASSVLSRFVRGEELTARVFYRCARDSGSTSEQPIPISQIREFVTEEHNPENRKQVDSVEVRGPFPEFDEDLVLIDTPGAGSIHEHHDQIVRSVIPQSDAVLFLVTAQMPLDQDELELLRQLREADVRKLVFAINRVDQATPEQLMQGESHNRELLLKVGVSADRIHPISAKLAFQGRTVESGLEPLLAEMRQLIGEGRAQTLRDRFVDRVRSAIAPVLEGINTELSLLGKSADEREAAHRELMRRRSELPAAQENAGRRFIAGWNRVCDTFAANLQAERATVENQLLERVDRTSLTGISALARKLPAQIMSEIETVVGPHAHAAESALQRLSRDLDGEFPQLAWDSTGHVSIGRGSSISAAIGTATGTAAAITGGGLILGSQAAAAAAVTYVTTPSMVGTALAYFTGTTGPFLTTTAVPTAVAPWVVMSGPVGWTLIGLGSLAIPIGWTLGRIKLKDQLRPQVQQQIDRVFQFLLEERLKLIRSSAESIVGDYQLRAEQQRQQIEDALERANSADGSPETKQAPIDLRERLDVLLPVPEESP